MRRALAILIAAVSLGGVLAVASPAEAAPLPSTCPPGMYCIPGGEVVRPYCPPKHRRPHTPPQSHRKPCPPGQVKHALTR